MEADGLHSLNLAGNGAALALKVVAMSTEASGSLREAAASNSAHPALVQYDGQEVRSGSGKRLTSR